MQILSELSKIEAKASSGGIAISTLTAPGCVATAG
jgi:hypothetical protein